MTINPITQKMVKLLHTLNKIEKENLYELLKLEFITDIGKYGRTNTNKKYLNKKIEIDYEGTLLNR